MNQRKPLTPSRFSFGALAFFFFVLFYSSSSLVSAQNDGYYYYNYYYENPNNSSSGGGGVCVDDCQTFGTNSSSCLHSCSTCGFDVAANECIFVEVGSWGCPDGGDNVILSATVTKSCSNDALTVCDKITAGFFLANCVSGGLYFFTFWSFIWVARSSGRYGPLLKWTVITGFVNLTAFIVLAVLLYVYAYCTAAKTVFVVCAVTSFICWLITLFRACGWFPLHSSENDHEDEIVNEEKALEMPARAAPPIQAQIKQVQVLNTPEAEPGEANGTNGVVTGFVQVVPNNRNSQSTSDSNPLNHHNQSAHSSPRHNIPLDAEGYTSPQFTAVIVQ